MHERPGCAGDRGIAIERAEVELIAVSVRDDRLRQPRVLATGLQHADAK
jgi:hypothetical protein